MVWYYLGATEEPDDIKFPEPVIGLWSGMKAYQVGLVGGLALGAFGSFSRGKNLTKQLFFRDATVGMRNVSIFSAGAGMCLFPMYLNFNWDRLRFDKGKWYDHKFKQEKCFAIQHSIWQNRLDTLTIYGLILGLLFTRRSVFTKLIGMGEGFQVPVLGGATWGALLGTAFDLPLSILVPNYFAHNEDVDFINPTWVGLPAQD